jgi:hypothetical protein
MIELGQRYISRYDLCYVGKENFIRTIVKVDTDASIVYFSYGTAYKSIYHSPIDDFKTYILLTPLVGALL